MSGVDPKFDLSGEEARGLLWGLLAVDEQQLADNPDWPGVRQLIQDGLVRYRESDPEEHWQSYRELVEPVLSGQVTYGDCEDLACAVAAEDRVRFGVMSEPFAYQPSPALFHVVTAVPSGDSSRFGGGWPDALGAPPAPPGYIYHDPSAAAGMPTTHVEFGSVRGKPSGDDMDHYGKMRRGRGGGRGQRLGVEGRGQGRRQRESRGGPESQRQAAGRALGLVGSAELTTPVEVAEVSVVPLVVRAYKALERGAEQEAADIASAVARRAEANALQLSPEARDLVDWSVSGVPWTSWSAGSSFGALNPATVHAMNVAQTEAGIASAQAARGSSTTSGSDEQLLRSALRQAARTAKDLIDQGSEYAVRAALDVVRQLDKVRQLRGDPDYPGNSDVRDVVAWLEGQRGGSRQGSPLPGGSGQGHASQRGGQRGQGGGHASQRGGQRGQGGGHRLPQRGTRQDRRGPSTPPHRGQPPGQVRQPHHRGPPPHRGQPHSSPTLPHRGPGSGGGPPPQGSPGIPVPGVSSSVPQLERVAYGAVSSSDLFDDLYFLD